MTVLEAIQKSTEFLARKGVDSPRLQSEVLLASILQTQRLKLYLDFERKLTESQTSEFRELIRRRSTREPLQHILGTACFCGLDVVVNRHVLVPRPETELLAEQGWKHLNGLGRPSTFLDFGTGSGCIALAICHFASASKGLALDKSTEALAVARANAERHHVQERIQFFQSEGFAQVSTGERFDLIISNPPYISSCEIPTLEEEVRDYDPHQALDGGPDGLDFYRVLSREAQAFLATGGKLFMEFGDGQENQISAILVENGWSIEAILKDLTARPRLMVARRPES